MPTKTRKKSKFEENRPVRKAPVDPIAIAAKLKQAIMIEFPKLEDMDKVDVRFLFERDDQIRFRINGWKDVRESPNIVFSKYVVAWMEESGLKYKVVG